MVGSTSPNGKGSHKSFDQKVGLSRCSGRQAGEASLGSVLPQAMLLKTKDPLPALSARARARYGVRARFN